MAPRETIASVKADLEAKASQLATAHRAIAAHEATADRLQSIAAAAIVRANSWQLTASTYADPILKALNIARQARDRLPPFVWKLLPSPVRIPIDGIFNAVADYERHLGQLQQDFAAEVQRTALSLATPEGHIEGLKTIDSPVLISRTGEEL